MRIEVPTYGLLAILLFLASAMPALAGECCLNESQLSCCCSPEVMAEASTCAASVCDGQGLVHPDLRVSLLTTVASATHPRQLETELAREVSPRPQSRLQPVVTNDRAPPLLFLDETLCSLPPPKLAFLVPPL